MPLTTEYLQASAAKGRASARKSFQRVYENLTDDGTVGRRVMTPGEKVAKYDAEVAANNGFQAETYKKRLQYHKRWTDNLEEAETKALSDLDFRKKRVEEARTKLPPPVPVGSITQGPSLTHPNATDIAQPEGAPIFARLGGMVTLAEFAGDGNGLVKVTSPDGQFQKEEHLSYIAAKPGDVVRPGDIIGTVGQTGAASGPHQHTVEGQRGSTTTGY
jgi:murein DD-endopeptidase MepM/ murein hydrolase activator NlpD